MIPNPKLFVRMTGWLTVATLTASSLGAETGWQVRVGGAQIDPDVAYSEQNDGDLITVGSDDNLGLSLSFERRFTRLLGLEIGGIYGEPDLTVDARLRDGNQLSASDGVRFLAVSAGLNIHLTPNRAVDTYAGPMVAHVFFSDVGFSTQLADGVFVQTFLTDDDVALGAQIGADVSLGDGSWTLNLSGKYLGASLAVYNQEGEETRFDFDPLIFGIGVGFRF